LFFWRTLPIYSVGEIWWYTRPAEEFVKVHWAVSYSWRTLSIILWSSSLRTIDQLHKNGHTAVSLIDPYYLIGESKTLSNPISNQTGTSWFIYEIVIFFSRTCSSRMDFESSRLMYWESLSLLSSSIWFSGSISIFFWVGVAWTVYFCYGFKFIRSTSTSPH